MNIRLNNAYIAPNNKPKPAFGHNQGVLDTIKALEKRKTPELGQILQAHLQDVDLTKQDFVKTIQGYSDYWKQVLVKYAMFPKIKEQLKTVLGVK